MSEVSMENGDHTARLAALMGRLNTQQRACIVLTGIWILTWAMYWVPEFLQCVGEENSGCLTIFTGEMTAVDSFFYGVARILGFSFFGPVGHVISSAVIFPVAVWMVLTLLMISVRWILVGRQSST